MSVPTWPLPKPGSQPPVSRQDLHGSLLRPPQLLRERRALARGEIGQAELTRTEDAAIREAIASAGTQARLQSVTDGEFRRRSYHSFLLWRTQQCAHGSGIGGADAAGTQERAKRGAAAAALSRWRRSAAACAEPSDQMTRCVFPSRQIQTHAEDHHPGACAPLHFPWRRCGHTRASAYADVDLF